MKLDQHPLVSVVVPCYNQGQFLGECLASVRAQDYPAVEAVVVDDGSGRDTKDTIARLCQSLSFRLVTQENRGLSAARNAGIRAAAGRFVLPLDADNRIAPDAVSRLVSAFRAHRAADPRVSYIYQDKVWFGAEDRYIPHSEYNLFALMHDNFADACALIDRGVFSESGLWYDEAMRSGYEDWELFLRMGVHHLIGARLPGRTFFYRRWGFTMVDAADERRAELQAYIRRQAGALYFAPVAAAVKREWSPGVSVIADDPAAARAQTLQDVEVVNPEGAGEVAAVRAIHRARGKYWLLVSPGRSEWLARFPSALEQGVRFMEGNSSCAGLRYELDGEAVGRLVRARRLLEAAPTISAPTMPALDQAIRRVHPVPVWDLGRHSWAVDAARPVAVPTEAAARPRRTARWLKQQGKKWVAPRIGFERAAGIYFHQREVLKLLTASARPQAAPRFKPVGATGGAFPLRAPEASEAGHLREAEYRDGAPVRLPGPADDAALPPPNSRLLHAYRHGPVPEDLPGEVPQGVRARDRVLLLGADPHLVRRLHDVGAEAVVADLNLAALEQASGADARHDLAEWTPLPEFDGVVVSKSLGEVLGAQAAVLARAAMKPGAVGASVTLGRGAPRVLVAAPYLVTGGADRALLDLMRVLNAAQFSVLLATTEPSENPWLSEALRHVAAYWDVGALEATDVRRSELLADLVQSRGIDAVYVMHSRVGFDALPLIRRRRRVPVVAQYHLEEPVGQGGWAFYGQSRYANLIDRVVTVSRQLGDRLRSAYYVPADRIRPIHLGVQAPDEVPPLPPVADGLKILYPARLAAQKAPMTLVPLAKALRTAHIPAAIQVLGDGPLARPLRDAVARERLQPWVAMHGSVPAASMDEWYARAHLTLLTSAWEGLPLVLVESMARGRPAVAPDVGAVSEVVGPQTGRLVARPDDVAGYVAAIREYLDRPDLLGQHGAAGRDLARREFDPARSAQQYVSVFNELWRFVH